jgi:hypothetical protein
MNWKMILIAIAFLAIAGIAGRMDYEDAMLIEADYCERLAAGEHEDYNNLRDVCAERHWGK